MVIGQMDTIESDLTTASDRNRFFHATYNRTTHEVRDEIARGGFTDNDWSEAWDVAFADLYLQAFTAWREGEPTPRPWVVAFEASRSRLAPLRHVLLGMNAHINYDLPQALLAVISDGEFDDADLIALRSQDHKHIDTILASRVAAEDEFLAQDELPGDRTWIDTVIKPLNRMGTKRFLRESRLKVWQNTHVLAVARRNGQTEFEHKLAELEHLTELKVAELLQPGHVLLKLATRGFGVTLTP